MPGNRRAYNRAPGPGSSSAADKQKGHNHRNGEPTQPTATSSGTTASSSSPASVTRPNESVPVYDDINAVRHTILPLLPNEGTFLFEGLIFVFSIFAMGLQYVHIYKTVWWLPYSHSNYALNFYLIDPYLVIFILAVLSRRVIFTISRVVQFYYGRTRYRITNWLAAAFRVVLVGSLALTLFWTGFHVIKQAGLPYILILIYPFLMYVFLFGFKFKPFMGKTVIIHRAQLDRMLTRPREPRPDSLVHNCYACPAAIRQEVEILKTDFNKRLLQTLYNSFFSAYYACFVPLCFTQNTIYYDMLWAWSQVAMIWFAFFLNYFLHFLSAKYIDVLHRASLHLGKWSKLEGRYAHITEAWSELTIWSHASLVKHVKGHFKAEGILNAAEPGNSMHLRFHFLFYHPLRVAHGLLALSLALVAYQLVSLILASDWNHILSLTLYLFVSYYVLFKIMRDTLTLRKAYKDHEMIHTEYFR